MTLESFAQRRLKISLRSVNVIYENEPVRMRSEYRYAIIVAGYFKQLIGHRVTVYRDIGYY